MKTLKYSSGEEISTGDSVEYRGETGHVEFVVTGEDPSYAWYYEKFPGGGVMLALPSFGSLFLGIDDIDEDLAFRSRAVAS